LVYRDFSNSNRFAKIKSAYAELADEPQRFDS